MTDDDGWAVKSFQKLGRIGAGPTPSFGPSATERKQLELAFAYPFDEPVTAFLSRVLIISASCLGVTHRHVRADSRGQFKDGHWIRTSDIGSVLQVGGFWCLRTVTGSFYVLATFSEDGGKASLDQFLQSYGAGIHPALHRHH